VEGSAQSASTECGCLAGRRRNAISPFSCVIGVETAARGSPGHAVDAVSPTLVAIEDGNDT
jgi:hypothetical protein